jgi:hypothetical protein
MTPATRTFLRVSTDVWQAIGSLATAGALIVAVIVAVIAGKQFKATTDGAAAQLAADREAARTQLEQARKAALDQARPYVVVSVQSSPTSFMMLDFIIENAGAGPAFDVKISVDPPLRRTHEETDMAFADARIFREPLPMLPPRYVLRSHLDSTVERYSADGEGLPKTHAVTIAYHDGHGHEWTEKSTLDLTTGEGLLFVTEYGIHHVAEALQGMRDALKNSNLTTSPIPVTVETQAQYAARQAAARDERMARITEQRARRQSNVTDGPPAEATEASIADAEVEPRSVPEHEDSIEREAEPATRENGVE